MERFPRFAVGAAVVVLSMVVLFTVPSGYFVAATFASTACMIGASLSVGGYRRLFAPNAKTLLAGLGSALLLYLVFYGGSIVINEIHPFGVNPAAENSIYSLISSPTNPLYIQGGVLLFDAVGYESFFRGVLQKRVQSRVGPAAPFLVAAADSVIHVLTFNPLWVVTTFIVDSVWGITYYYTKDLSASISSHLCWVVLIFVIWPIR
ncbi:MAG: CPBP family glutamic-type intramembrane protease [Nitrososphaerales archaeon]|nr:CPBP family glutamic-type intramembrane protease [Nitrososphaerales archaeon]